MIAQKNGQPGYAPSSYEDTERKVPRCDNDRSFNNSMLNGFSQLRPHEQEEISQEYLI